MRGSGFVVLALMAYAILLLASLYLIAFIALSFFYPSVGQSLSVGTLAIAAQSALIAMLSRDKANFEKSMHARSLAPLDARERWFLHSMSF